MMTLKLIASGLTLAFLAAGTAGYFSGQQTFRNGVWTHPSLATKVTQLEVMESDQPFLVLAVGNGGLR